MKNTILIILAACFLFGMSGCKNTSKAKLEPTKNVKEEPNTKTNVIKVLVDEEETIDLKVDPNSKLGQLEQGNFVFLLGNLGTPSNLELKKSTILMTTISMQDAMQPLPVDFDREKQGMAAVIQSGLFHGEIYQASVVCICDRPLDNETLDALIAGKLYLDDICH